MPTFVLFFKTRFAKLQICITKQTVMCVYACFMFLKPIKSVFKAL